MSEVTKVSSVEQHFSVTLWLRARNLRVCAKHVDCVLPGLRALTVLEIRNVKLLN